MSSVYRRLCLVALATASLQGLAHAQGTTRVDVGKREFETRCASCHGMGGRGDGTITDLLRRSPPDLTQLARNNGGILPVQRIYDSITGDTVSAHGSRDMPVWGSVYRSDAATYYGELPYDPQAYVRARVLALVEYLSRLQAR